MLMSLSTPVFADEKGPDVEFTKGLESFEKGRFSEAIATWENLLGSLGEARGLKVLYNLGLAYEAAGDLTRAVERFQLFVGKLAEQTFQLTPELEERRQDAAERTAAIRRRAGAVRTAAHAGQTCLVRFDRDAPREAGFVAYLLPGNHQVQICLGTDDERTEGIQVVAGGVREVDTTRKGKTSAVDSSAPIPLTEPPTFPTPWVLGGGALFVVSFGLPIGLGYHAANLRENAVALTVGHTQYSAARKSYEDARTAYVGSFVVPAALGLATAVSALVFAVRVATYEPGLKSRPVALSVSPGGIWLQTAF